MRTFKRYDGERFRDRILGNMHEAIDQATGGEWTTMSCRILVAVVDELYENSDEWACLLSAEKE